MIEISTAHNEARLAGSLAHFDAGAGSARIRIYSGVRPAFGAAPSGSLLCEFVLSEPCGSVASGVLTLTLPPEAQVLATGVAAWARIVNGADAVAMDCDCSDNAGAGEVKLANTQLYAGGYAALTSAVLG